MAVLSGLLAAGAAISGAALGAKATNKASRRAAEAQTATAAENNALQREIYGKNEGYLSPYIAQGQVASNAINELLGLAPPTTGAAGAFANFRNSDGYQFRLNEGMNALQSGLRGSGLSQSGKAVKSYNRLGQDYGSNELGRYIGYVNNQQGVGLTGASALAGVGQGFANSVSANNQNAADAISNSALIRGQNTASIYGTAANALGQIGANFASSYGGGSGYNAFGTPYSGSKDIGGVIKGGYGY